MLPPPPKQTPPASYTCHRCKQPGHYIHDCPTNTCFTCGVSGHMASHCTGHKRNQLLVRNLSDSTTCDDVKHEFRRYGNVKHVYIPRDYHTKQSRGFSFVEFFDERDAEDARRDMDGRRFAGRNVTVIIADEQHRKTPEEMKTRMRGSAKPTQVHSGGGNGGGGSSDSPACRGEGGAAEAQVAAEAAKAARKTRAAEAGTGGHKLPHEEGTGAAKARPPQPVPTQLEPLDLGAQVSGSCSGSGGGSGGGAEPTSAMPAPGAAPSAKASAPAAASAPQVVSLKLRAGGGEVPASPVAAAAAAATAATPPTPTAKIVSLAGISTSAGSGPVGGVAASGSGSSSGSGRVSTNITFSWRQLVDNESDEDDDDEDQESMDRHELNQLFIKCLKVSLQNVLDFLLVWRYSPKSVCR
jgi:hypothetical protein